MKLCGANSQEMWLWSQQIATPCSDSFLAQNHSTLFNRLYDVWSWILKGEVKLANCSCLDLNVGFFGVKLQIICKFSRVERCCFTLVFLSLDHWMHSLPWTCFITNLFVLLLNSLFASFRSRLYHSSLDPPLYILPPIWSVLFPQNHSLSLVFLQTEFVPWPSWTDHCKYNFVFCSWWMDKRFGWVRQSLDFRWHFFLLLYGGWSHILSSWAFVCPKETAVWYLSSLSWWCSLSFHWKAQAGTLPDRHLASKAESVSGTVPFHAQFKSMPGRAQASDVAAALPL